MDFVFDVIISVFVIVVSVIFHEVMHGLVAYFLGDSTAKDAGRLSLNPLKHLDPIYSLLFPIIMYICGMPILGGAIPVPVNKYNLKGKEWGMALVAIAGPITNVLLAFLSFLILYICSFNNVYIYDWIVVILKTFMSVNISLACFNILPIPPLDGSRVLFAIAPDIVRNFMSKIELFGLWIIYIIMMLSGGFFSGLINDMIMNVYNFFLWIVGM